MKKVLNNNEMNIIVNKLNLNIKDEKEIFIKLSENLINFENYYKTDNKLMLKDLEKTIVLKTHKFEQIHDSYLSFLDTIIKNYDEVNKKVENILKDI